MSGPPADGGQCVPNLVLDMDVGEWHGLPTVGVTVREAARIMQEQYHQRCCGDPQDCSAPCGNAHPRP